MLIAGLCETAIFMISTGRRVNHGDEAAASIVVHDSKIFSTNQRNVLEFKCRGKIFVEASEAAK